jgi:Pyruvate/2-oxoacid:ferredoxin oxidoreductase delta subunit
MLGLDPEELPVLKVAREMGFPATEAQIDGDWPSIPHFKLPTFGSLFMGPKFLHGFIRRQVLQRPRCDTTACRMCGECWKICPARAIEPEQKPLRFAYERCIRCWCCLEVCPFGAIRSVETLTGRIVRGTLSLILPPGKTR